MTQEVKENSLVMNRKVAFSGKSETLKKNKMDISDLKNTVSEI